MERIATDMKSTLERANLQDPNWQQTMAVRIDFNNMLAPVIGREEGLDPKEVFGLQERINEVDRQLRTKTGKGSDFLGWMELPYQGDELLDRIQATADKLANTSDIHVVLGIGGSYLGSRAVIEALLPTYRNETSREARQNRPRIYFEGNNMDPDALNALFDLMPKQKPVNLAETFSLNVISKSGGTVETAVAFRLFHQLAKQVYGQDYAKYIVATTDASKGKLRAIADAEGFESFVISDDVGGRYSVLTPVGLLPAAVAGVDIHGLVAGARFMAEKCKNADLHQNPAYLYAALQYLSYTKGKKVSIMAAWSKALEFVGFWYDQLCAESVGKDEMGRVPLTSVNTRDLHARGQEIQDGERNTVVTNLVVENFHRDIVVPRIDSDLDGLNYLAGKTIGEMQIKAMEGTAYAYARDGRPSMNVLLPEINAFTLGQLFYLFELATVAEGYLMGVNPLDQPGVEAYKKFMFGNLGRADMAKYKEEFDARPKGSSEYLV